LHPRFALFFDRFKLFVGLLDAEDSGEELNEAHRQEGKRLKDWFLAEII